MTLYDRDQNALPLPMVANGTAQANAPPRSQIRQSRRMERHAGDIVRMVLAAALLTVSVLAVQRDRVSLAERDLFRLINDLPDVVYGPVWAVMQLGNLFAPVVVGVAVALLLRQRRLGASIATAGVMTWLVAKVVKQFVERGRPAEFLADLLHNPTTTGLGFVSGHAAVAAGIATAAAPYLPRRSRRIIWALAWIVGFGRVYTGAHLPLDVVGGIAVGWFVGSLVHAVFGAPHHAPSAADVGALLRRSGIDVAAVEPADVIARSSHPFRATVRNGESLFVKVLDPDRRDTDWLFRAARLVLFRDVRDVDALAPLRNQVEHEAAATLAASAVGVRVPHVHVARGDGSSALLVLADVQGRSLDAVPPAEIDDDVLRSTWQQVRLLHEHRIAHGDLVRANVQVDQFARPWLVDFGNAEQGADDAALATDVAELLASFAVVVGTARAVATARDVMTPGSLAEAVGSLEPLALSGATRHELRGQPGILPALRAELATELATTPGLGPPPVWVLALAAAITFGGLPAFVGWTEVWGAVTGIAWRWLGLAILLSLAAALFEAGLLLASVRRRLAFGRTAVSTLRASMADVVHGLRGRRQHQIAFLRRHGIRREAAVHGVDASLVCELIGYILATATMAAIVLDSAGPTLTIAGRAVSRLIAVAVIAAIAGATVRRITADRAMRSSWLRDGLRSLRKAPSPAAPLVATFSAAAAYLALSGALAAALAAAGAGTGVARPMLGGLVAHGALRSLRLDGLPIVEEATLVAGLVAFSVPAVPAVAGVLVYRLLVFWLAAAATIRR